MQNRFKERIYTYTKSKSVVYVETDKYNVPLLLSWIFYHVSTVLDVVRLGSSIRSRRYAFCIKGTRVRCACEVRQHYLCKIMRIPWKFFQRINPVLSFIDIFYYSFFLQTYYYKVYCSPCINLEECNRSYLSLPVLIYTVLSIFTNITSKYIFAD